jgi:hypothetical protein
MAWKRSPVRSRPGPPNLSTARQTKQILERQAPANGHCPNLELGHYLPTNTLDFTGEEMVLWFAWLVSIRENWRLLVGK